MRRNSLPMSQLKSIFVAIACRSRMEKLSAAICDILQVGRFRCQSDTVAKLSSYA